VELRPEKRHRKIYVDFLQNREGQTLAAPYSVRPTPDATVSMPLHWDEVKSGLKPTDFTIKNALVRLKREGDLCLGAIYTRKSLSRPFAYWTVMVALWSFL
jgi:bifunctional non-homologous end joining protein LigD